MLKSLRRELWEILVFHYSRDLFFFELVVFEKQAPYIVLLSGRRTGASARARSPLSRPGHPVCLLELTQHIFSPGGHAEPSHHRDEVTEQSPIPASTSAAPWALLLLSAMGAAARPELGLLLKVCTGFA